MLGKLVSNLGYEVVYGSNGYEAVDVFQRTLAAESAEQDELFCVLMVRPAFIWKGLLRAVARFLGALRLRGRWHCAPGQQAARFLLVRALGEDMGHPARLCLSAFKPEACSYLGKPYRCLPRLLRSACAIWAGFVGPALFTSGTCGFLHASQASYRSALAAQDINMPELDGLQATQQIRRLEESAHSRAIEPEAVAVREDASSTCSDGSAKSARRVPIIAVSACSETDQLLSPALANVDVSAGATPCLWRSLHCTDTVTLSPNGDTSDGRHAAEGFAAEGILYYTLSERAIPAS